MTKKNTTVAIGSSIIQSNVNIDRIDPSFHPFSCVLSLASSSARSARHLRPPPSEGVLRQRQRAGARRHGTESGARSAGETSENPRGGSGKSHGAGRDTLGCCVFSWVLRSGAWVGAALFRKTGVKWLEGGGVLCSRGTDRCSGFGPMDGSRIRGALVSERQHLRHSSLPESFHEARFEGKGLDA